MAAKDIKKYQFKPGQSGNPTGRKKKIPLLTEALANILDAASLQELLQNLMKKAVKGDIQAAKILLEYSYPKPKRQPPTEPPEVQVKFIG